MLRRDELEYEPKCHLTRPMVVSGDKNVVLTSWPKYTDDEHILLRSEDLLTVCEPTERVLEAYMKKCGIKASDLNCTKAGYTEEEPTASLATRRT